MKKIFTNSHQLQSHSLFQLDGPDYFHLARVLRVKKGDQFIIGNPSAKEYRSVIAAINSSTITFSIQEEIRRTKNYQITLFFSLLK
ncbi:MAG: 16S rRNA (uracil(1498)-N(3))-methyltransferase, partial [Spirochaetes bacterium]|nr:16S rRNA (uracil(1498)-N(3))-methyltransferase [Spirochaetota bacterium]